MRAALPFALAGLALLSGCASAPPAPKASDNRRFTASPTVLVAASARLAAEIRASDEPADIFRDEFTEDAIVIADRLRTVADMGVSRETMLQQLAGATVQDVVISCDGRTGMSSGALPPGETFQSYDIVWKRVEKDWRVAIVHLDTEAAPQNTTGFIHSVNASCASRPQPKAESWAANGSSASDGSEDASLYWSMWLPPVHEADFALHYWNGAEWVDTRK